MWLYIKLLIQLLLSPARGWEDVSEASIPADTLQSKGYYPLMAVTALSEFLPMLYSHSIGFINALLSAIVVVGVLCASLYMAKLFMDLTLPRFTGVSLNVNKVNTFVVCMLGLNCIFYIFNNAMPASMTFLRLLPLLSVIIIFKATAYMGVPEDYQLNFTGLGIVAVIMFPLALSSLILCFI